MRSKLLKIFGGILIGVAPLAYLMIRFSTTSEEVVVTEGGGLPFVPLILVILFSVVIIMFITAQITNSLKKHPFSTMAILFYGGLGMVLSFYGIIMMGSIRTGVEENVALFIANISEYIQALQYILFMQLGGAFILVGNLLLDARKAIKG